ncbi:hypothetical protein [Clostridium sardiniense]|uniref:hypothetical protein n=1 Tax=Clostridium sardiniense TaxID=29369 RepID=UPI00195BA87A|nr:hypothetical protein [Clostridium sardiniense]MBM7836035.1 hypothetical protein [Clostridium sardiniense]
MIIEILKLSIVFTIGITIILIAFGLIIGQVEKKSNELIYGTFGRYGIIFTGIIGTTVHEFSHYIMCKLFFHKVTEVKWFSIKLDGSGELGHVRHTFNPKNIYQRIGNFFIGVAPIFVGTLMIIIILRLLLPSTYLQIVKSININEISLYISSLNFIEFFKELSHELFTILNYLFSIENLVSFKFWIFIIISLSISNHMSLSRADVKNSLDGIGFIFLLSILISAICILFGISFNNVLVEVITFNSLLIAFLSVGLLFSIVALILSKLICFKSYLS